jgi:heavy metal translocating P-type ATPase
MAAPLLETEETGVAAPTPALVPSEASPPANSRLRATQVWAVARANPVPVVALLGLVSGAVLQWGLALPEAAWWTWMATVVIGGAPLVLSTLRGMLRGEFASDVVAMLAIVAALITNEPFAGAIVVLMQSGGETLERYGLRRASSSLERLLARAPRTAWRRAGERLTEIPVAEVEIGDILVVRPGALAPVDGGLLSAQAMVDEAAITGEPLAHTKHTGDHLLSGGVNVGDAFEMRATARSDDSQYAKIVSLVRQAQRDKAPIGRLADRFAIWFTPLTLLMCAFGWWITGEAQTVMAVLVVATPCPLILATPVAVISGINRAAKAGIIVKGGAAIEQIGRAQAVVFDKTGTLTFGSPMVERLIAAGGHTSSALLRKAGSVEQLSSHLLAQTLTGAATAEHGPLPLPTEFHEAPGGGVHGMVDHEHVAVGSVRFLREQGVSDAALDALATHAAAEDLLAAFIAVDHVAAGVALFSDRIRPGVPQLVERLRHLGVRRTVMLTGDRMPNALAVAREAGIDEVEANLLPADKVRIVQRLKEQYDPLVMVGDGINDAPALATATVGVAMGAGGSGISAEAADIVLLVDDVTLVGEAVAIGRRMVRVAKQSIFAGLGLSLVLMVIASFGLIPPAIGAVCQEVIDVAVILNALRAR